MERAPTLRPMRADRAKQLLKNGVYRAIGETVERRGAARRGADRTLRVLMYHKVNDLWPNPTTVPTAVFDEQMAPARRARLRAVSLDAVLDHYLRGAPAPPAGGAPHLRRRLPGQPRERAPDPAPPRLSGRALRPDRVPRRHAAAAARGVAAAARGSRTRRSTGTSSPSSRREASASSRTGSVTSRSPSSSPPRRRARSRSRSCGSRSGSGARSRRSRS